MMEALFQACCERPCDLAKIRLLLETNHYSSQELTQTALRFVDDECYYDSWDFHKEHGREPERGELSVHYLYDVLALFLAFGMDPNDIEDDDNLMSALGYIYSLR